MNCVPAPFPTFFAPAGSKAGPPAAFVEATAVLEPNEETAEDTADAEPVEPKPQPVFPFCVEAPVPEQIPVGLAQQPLPQSAFERHWPPIN